MPAENTQRASPEALLELAKKEARGHLKIFLGAAPGVGKTYAMLTSARAEKAGGRDVVAGLVETHGRRETELLLEGFETVPRKSIVYRNQIMKEFDLDAALVRRPSLLLVDEFAHTNVPGSKHPKRWQDIDELLGAGIDVWTTLNIQHLESLNEVIQQITKVRVRETVPDSVFDRADEIVLVDFPPDELLKRLAEGKVYVQETAERAVQSFFKPQNLTALRELALRRAAERIDSALVDRMQAQAIEGPWAAGERILACVGSDPYSFGIVRTAKRLADLMDAPWIAVTVEKPGRPLSEAARRRVDAALKLAETLGADTNMLVGNDLIAELLRFARFENVTQIVIGRSRGGIFATLLGRSLPNELVRRADDIAIHVVTGRAEPESGLRWPKFSLPRELAFAPYAWSTLVVAVAILVGELMTTVTRFPNVSMVFLMAVLFPAVLFGSWPAIFASVISFLSYNFFFIEPLYTLTVAQPHELFALFVFLAVAIITSTLAGRIREQAKTAAERMRATRRLYEFTKKLSALVSPDAITEAAATEINASLSRPTVVLRAEGGELLLCAAWPPEDALDTASMTAARWAFDKDEPAGSATSTLPTVPWYFVPLRTPRSRVGVLGIGQARADQALDSESRALFDALAEQTAAALERAALGRETVGARTAAETERVRNTLLASISHDFRTPLASILGSATSLLEFRKKLTPDAQTDLLLQIKQEAECLDEMVRNLLAVSRIDAGMLELRKDWVDLREVVERTVSAARRRGSAQQIAVALPEGMPPVRVDASLAEQAIGNVVGNALKYTPAEANIVVDGEMTSDAVVLRVTDDGPGIPPDALPRVFEKFFRAPTSDAARASGSEGTGLGLAIAKGIMEAHGGSISAASPVEAGHGTRIILSFPRSVPEKAE